jgi:hypothetical protein
VLSENRFGKCYTISNLPRTRLSPLPEYAIGLQRKPS